MSIVLTLCVPLWLFLLQDKREKLAHVDSCGREMHSLDKDQQRMMPNGGRGEDFELSFKVETCVHMHFPLAFFDSFECGGGGGGAGR